MKILARSKTLIHVAPGDTLRLSYRDASGERVVVDHQITEAQTFDEGVAFETEFEGKRALGGMFVSTDRVDSPA